MKKTLLFGGLLLTSFGINAQVLQSDNFDAVPVGNVSSDITGATAGAGGFYVLASNGAAPTTGTNASAASVRIVASGQAGNGLLIESSNGDKGSRFVLKPGLDTAWDTRTSGNNVIQLEFDFYTGPASTSTTQNGATIYGEDGTTLRSLGGFVYVPSTKQLSGVAYLKNGVTFGTYLVGLGATSATPIVLADNTWYRLGVSYNTANGQVVWKGPGFDNVSIAAANYAGPFAPVEARFTSLTPATNTTSAQQSYDNYVVTAVPTSNLLNVREVASLMSLNVFPNPSNGIVNISNSENALLNNVSVTDLNGRTVKNVQLNGATEAQINISDLSAGVYMMNISSDQGSVTKKIVKN